MIKKDVLKVVFNLFCGITTALILFLGIQGAFFVPDFSFSGWDLIRFLSISLASTLPTLLILGRKPTKRGKWVLLLASHFVLTAGAVFGLLMIYEWINAATALYTILMFLGIYVVAYTALEIRARRLAKMLNEKINAFHEAENEAHDD